ncbi:DNA polymerase eta-like [Mercenaria mercenaria]|uniref:DNA polymerase eta-like n=1 Tax=Mercenaria mercenaria TaxID=6596 RepID=UPI00234E9258|nr:DNA polymerase eta-like [Mercenaria mercenaria]XP_053404418.1 DNA polymerase eta-like [Mercenaria mercenaria]
MERIVALVDMDCFYVQVEQRLNPSLKGKPCAVVQYNPWKGGGIIAVSYEARNFGVTRQMRGDDAKAKCPDIQLVRVPLVRGKADLTKYREGGAEVIEVLSRFSNCVERASVDEAYIDLTEEVEKRLSSLSQDRVTIDKLPNTHVVGFNKDKDGRDLSDWLSVTFDEETMDCYNRRLAVGAVIAEEMRAAVYNDTGFRCSAGIAHNKMLSKLACGFHKPNKQTILPHSEVPKLYSTLPIRKIRNLGGKMGQLVMEHLQAENMGDLLKFSEKALQQLLGDKNGSWLYEVCRGFDHEPVAARQLPKSIGCSKTFTGKNCLNTREKVKFWLSELAKEVHERLEKDKENNKRTAKSLTLSVRYENHPRPVSASRVCALIKYDPAKFSSDAFTLVQQFNTSPPHQASWCPPIICLGLSAGKFHDDSAAGVKIGEMFARKDHTISLTQSENFVNQSQFDFVTDNQSDERGGKTVIKNKDQSVIEESSAKEEKKGSIMSFFSQKMNDKVVGVTSTSPISEDAMEMTKDSQQTRKSNDNSLKSFFKRKQLENLASMKVKAEINEEHKQTPSTSSPIQNNSFFKQKMESVNNLQKYRSNITGKQNVEIVVDDEEESTDFVDDSDSEVEEITSMTVEGNKSEEVKVDEEDNKASSCQETYLEKDNSERSKNLSTSSFPAEDFMQCEKCDKLITVWEMPEHMDFHFAVELQKNMNTEDRNSAANQVKRKSIGVSGNERTSKKVKLDTSQGKLDTFFTKLS